jgi:hypothetical protein
MKAIDTQKEKRNFPGFKKEVYYSLADIQTGDGFGMSGGTTDTDSKTSSKNDQSATRINKKQGKGRG